MASGASKGAKKIRPFDEQSTQLAMGKTASQVHKTQQLNKVKKLTKEGKHVEAQKLYKQAFPPV